MNIGLSPHQQDFIQQHIDNDIHQLSLQYTRKDDGENYPFLIQQIAARQKLKHKIPRWVGHTQTLFPPLRNLAQSSSEITAAYKSKLVSGNSGADLTAGFGVDTFYFAQRCTDFHYVEPDNALVGLARHNFSLLDVHPEMHNCTCEQFLEANSRSLDFFYIDPSRKDEHNQRAVFLEDYSPNVIELSQQMLSQANEVLIKTSPMLDISDAVTKLQTVAEIHIVAVDNEVKEVLYRVVKEVPEKCQVYAVNLSEKRKSSTFEVTWGHFASDSEMSMPKRYLYEPNAAIMKSGAFHDVSQRYAVAKLHANSHLYTSDELKKDFPGRVFELVDTLPYQRKAFKSHSKANITVRNFPDSVERIRKKLAINPGGSGYLFATTLIDNKPVLLDCRKIED